MFNEKDRASLSEINREILMELTQLVEMERRCTGLHKQLLLLSKAVEEKLDEG